MSLQYIQEKLYDILHQTKQLKSSHTKSNIVRMTEAALKELHEEHGIEPPQGSFKI